MTQEFIRKQFHSSVDAAREALILAGVKKALKAFVCILLTWIGVGCFTLGFILSYGFSWWTAIPTAIGLSLALAYVVCFIWGLVKYKSLKIGHVQGFNALVDEIFLLCLRSDSRYCAHSGQEYYNELVKTMPYFRFWKGAVEKDIDKTVLIKTGYCPQSGQVEIFFNTKLEDFFKKIEYYFDLVNPSGNFEAAMAYAYCQIKDHESPTNGTRTTEVSEREGKNVLALAGSGTSRDFELIQLTLRNRYPMLDLAYQNGKYVWYVDRDTYDWRNLGALNQAFLKVQEVFEQGKYFETIQATILWFQYEANNVWVGKK